MTAALSTRALKAVEVLKNGGEFRYALETDPYTKRWVWTTTAIRSKCSEIQTKTSSD